MARRKRTPLPAGTITLRPYSDEILESFLDTLDAAVFAGDEGESWEMIYEIAYGMFGRIVELSDKVAALEIALALRPEADRE